MAGFYPTIWDPSSNPPQRSATASDTLLGAFANPEVESLTNGESGAVTRGMPVYIQSANTVKKAQANASATAIVYGLVSDATISAGNPANIISDGPLTATTAQWDAVCTGESGGLTPGTTYWLDPAAAGKITATPPAAGSADIAVQIGKARSTTILNVKIYVVQVA